MHTLFFALGILFGVVLGGMIVVFEFAKRIIGTLKVDDSKKEKMLLYLEADDDCGSKLDKNKYVLLRVAKGVYIPQK